MRVGAPEGDADEEVDKLEEVELHVRRRRRAFARASIASAIGS